MRPTHAWDSKAIECLVKAKANCVTERDTVGTCTYMYMYLTSLMESDPHTSTCMKVCLCIRLVSTSRIKHTNTAHEYYTQIHTNTVIRPLQ